MGNLVLVIGEDGTKLGEMSLEKAKQMATDAKKSLVLVNPRANVYRIVDQGKLKYEQKQKERDSRAQKRTHKVKEIRFNLTTEQNDIDVKVRKIKEFLSDGLKVKLVMRLHGRESALQNVGLEKINKVVESVLSESSFTVDKSAALEGKNIVVFCCPAK